MATVLLALFLKKIPQALTPYVRAGERGGDSPLMPITIATALNALRPGSRMRKI